MNLTVNSTSSPSVDTESVTRTAATISAPGTPVFDSELLATTGATAWNEFVLSAASLNVDLTFESVTPAVCSVASTGEVTRVAAGMGVVMVSDGGPSRKRVTLDMRSTGGQTITEFSGYTADSLSDLCASEVIALLTAGGTLNYYSTINHVTSTYPRNAGCWLADVDLSAVSVANRDAGGSWRHTRAGTAITTRHVAFAAHYTPPVGAELRFVNAAGTVFTHTILAYHGAVTAGEDVLNDLSIAVITPALDASITPMKVAGPWIMQGVTSNGYYTGGIAAWIDQLKNCYATHVGYRTSSISSSKRTGTFNSTVFTDIMIDGKIESILSQTESPYLESFASFTKLPVGGDSGSPVMLVIGGDPILLWTWHTAASGTPVYASTALVNARIASADAAAGISTGLTVTVAPDPTL